MERTWQEEEGQQCFRSPSVLFFQSSKPEKEKTQAGQVISSLNPAVLLFSWSSWPSSAAAPRAAAGAPRAASRVPRVLATHCRSSQSSGVGVEEICEASGGSGSSLHPQSCSSPQSGGTAGRHWRGTRGWALGRTLRSTLGWAFGGTLGWGLALLLVLQAGHLGRNWMELEENREILSLTNPK